MKSLREQVRSKSARKTALPCGRLKPQKAGAGLPKRFSTAQAAWAQKLNLFLANKRLKRSEQRLRVVEVFWDLGGHLTAQELVREVTQRFPAIGVATVYRNIKLLCEAKILHEAFSDGEGRAIYEFFDDDGEHHDHMVCRDCGTVFEFHSEEIEALQQSLLKKEGFREDGHRHVVYVRCTKLSSQEINKARPKKN